MLYLLEIPVADTSDAPSVGIPRRDLIIAGAGAILALGTGRAETVSAQTGPASTQSVPPGNVVVERRGALLLVGIDRPQAQNLLDPPILIGLGKAYYQLEHDDELRVAVLHGLGSNFSLGVDLAALVAAQASGAFPPKDPDFINSFGLRPPFRSKPVVVAVQGGVRFGGHELFLASDIRVAAADATFNQGEVTRGVFPGGGATVRLTREIGWGNAMRYMLTGEVGGRGGASPRTRAGRRANRKAARSCDRDRTEDRCSSTSWRPRDAGFVAASARERGSRVRSIAG